MRVATTEECLRYGQSGLCERELRAPMAGGSGYSLIGTAGAVTAAAASVVPALGSNEPATKGNLLLGWAVNTTATNAVTVSAPWFVFNQTATANAGSVVIFYKLAQGADASPTVTSTAGNIVASMAEFYGNTNSSTSTALRDQNGGNSAASSPVTATTGAVDANSYELVLYVSASGKSGAGNTNTLTDSLNNTTALNDIVNNGATSGTAHWAWGWAITTKNDAAISNTFSVSDTTNINAMTTLVVSFRLAAAPWSPTWGSNFC